MLDLFFQFLKTGKCDEESFSPIEKFKLIGGVFLHIFLLSLFGGLISEFIFWADTYENISATDTPPTLSFVSILKLIAQPLFAGLAFWLAITKFDLTKIKISISTVLSSAICYLLWHFNSLSFISQKEIQIAVIFVLIFGICFATLSVTINKRISLWLEEIWKNKFTTLIYLSAFFFSCIHFLITENIWIIIVNMIVSFGAALGLLFVRNQIGLRYAIATHYLFLSPIILISLYAYCTQ